MDLSVYERRDRLRFTPDHDDTAYIIFQQENPAPTRAKPKPFIEEDQPPLVQFIICVYRCLGIVPWKR